METYPVGSGGENRLDQGPGGQDPTPGNRGGVGAQQDLSGTGPE